MIQDPKLFGRHILLVEDDYLQGFSLRNELLDRGSAVIGPLGNVETAIAEARSEQQIDAAIIDVNVDGELAFPLVDELVQRDIPVVFATAYGPEVLPFRLQHLPRLGKPVPPAKLAAVLGDLIAEAKHANQDTEVIDSVPFADAVEVAPPRSSLGLH